MSSWRGQSSHLKRVARHRATHRARAKVRVHITRPRKVPNQSAGGTGAQAASCGAVLPGTTMWYEAGFFLLSPAPSSRVLGPCAERRGGVPPSPHPAAVVARLFCRIVKDASSASLRGGEALTTRRRPRATSGHPDNRIFVSPSSQVAQRLRHPAARGQAPQPAPWLWPLSVQRAMHKTPVPEQGVLEQPRDSGDELFEEH